MEKCNCNDDTINLLKECDAGSKMAVTSIDDVLDDVNDEKLEKILIETDCPYMAPEPYRGKRNSSLYLPYVIKKIAEIKGVSIEEVENVTEANARRLFQKVR